MHPLRRVTAIVLNVLLIQLSLAGYGPTCAQRDEAMSSTTNATMTMTMTHVADAPSGPARACVDPAAGERCSLPCPPEACATMTACAALALPVRTAVLAADAVPRDRAWRDPALGRLAPRPAPDLPPPRA